MKSNPQQGLIDTGPQKNVTKQRDVFCLRLKEILVILQKRYGETDGRS